LVKTPRSKSLALALLFMLVGAGLFSCTKEKPASQLVLPSETASSAVAAPDDTKDAPKVPSQAFVEGVATAAAVNGEDPARINQILAAETMNSGCSWRAVGGFHKFGDLVDPEIRHELRKTALKDGWDVVGYGHSKGKDPFWLVVVVDCTAD